MRNDVCDIIENLGTKQLKLFTKILRKHLFEQNIPLSIVDNAIKQAIVEFRDQESFATDCAKAISKDLSDSRPKENRGIDSIGRILIEFCFFRSPKTKMIWPENSEQDQMARESFSKILFHLSVFLLTTLSIDHFEASSVLFGEENSIHEQRKDLVTQLITEFESSNSNEGKIDWRAYTQIFVPPNY